MRTFLALLIAISLSAQTGMLRVQRRAAAAPAWSKGFNFRATAGYVTDPADSTYVLGSETTDTTRNGVTFKWSLNLSGSSRDRSASIDPRLAGVNARSNTGASAVFSFTLPSTGNYSVRVAMGDAGASENSKVVIKDGSTPLLTVGKTTTTSGHFIDASGVDRTSAAWPGDNVAATLAFSSTSFVMELGANDAVANNSTIAHLQVTKVD